MTDPTAPLSDEDLSAALDGEASPDVTARIAADEAARARSAELAVASRFVATEAVPSLDEATIDDLVASALAASASPGTGSGRSDTDTGDEPVAAVDDHDDGPTATPVVALSSRRRSPPPTWVVAAAVAAVLAVGLGLIWSGRSSDQTQTAAGQRDRAASSSAGRDEDAGGSGGGTVESGASESESTSTATATSSPTTSTADSNVGAADPAGADPLDLGTFRSTDDLRQSLAASFPTEADARSAPNGTSLPSAGPAPGPAAVDRCASLVQATLGLSDAPVRRGYATVDGTDALVYEFAAGSSSAGGGPPLVAAVGLVACDPLLTFER